MTTQMPLFARGVAKMMAGPPAAATPVARDANEPIALRNFESFIEAAGGLAHVRRLVLELAIRGALVPQQSSEGDGGTVMLRAKQHEAKLVSNGKLRRRATQTPVSVDERPFAVPPSWAWARFGELGDWGAGATPARGNASYYGGTMPWLKSGELNDGYVHDSEEHVTDLALRECSLRVNQPGDVLIAMYGATIGKVALARVTCTTNQAVCACTCFDGIHNEFLLRVLKAFKPRFVEQGAGGAQPNISRVKIVETPCPVPPLAEQKRIVARVDQLMALIDDLEAKQTKRRDLSTRFTKASLEALTTADSPEAFDTAWQRVLKNWETVARLPADVLEIKKTVIELAIRGRLVDEKPGDGDAPDFVRADEAPYPLPAGWRWGRVELLASHVVDCLHSTPQYTSSGVAAIRTADVVPGRLLLHQARTIDEEQYLERIQRLEPRSGDIFYSREGERLGIAACVPQGVRACLAQRMMHIRIKEPLFSPYIMWAMNSRFVYSQAVHDTGGSTSPHINMKDIRRFLLPVPPVPQQERIVAKLENLMKLCDDLEAKLRRAEDRASKLVEAVVQEMVA